MPTASSGDLVAAAKSRITTLSMEAARREVETGRAVFVDIRDHPELDREGLMPGAVHVPRGMLEFCVDPESPFHRPELASGRRLILFCAGAARSALAVEALLAMGLADTAEMADGFEAWKEAGYPVEYAGG